MKKATLLLVVCSVTALLQGCGNNKPADNDAATDGSPNGTPSGFSTEAGFSKSLAEAGAPKSWDDAKSLYEKHREDRLKRLGPQIARAEQVLVEPYRKYPQDLGLPQPPKTEVYFSRESADWKTRKSKLVILTSKDTTENLINFYENKFKAENWTLIKTEGNPAYASSTLRKDDQELKVTIYVDLYPDERVVHLETSTLGRQKRS